MPAKEVKTSPYIVQLYAKYLADVTARQTEVAATLTLAHIIQETACDLVEIIKKIEIEKSSFQA